MAGPSLQSLVTGGDVPEALGVSDALEAYEAAMLDPSGLMATARAARESARGHIVSFSKKAFVSVTTLCRDVCSYCAYRSEPGGEAFMPEGAVRALLENARRHGCVEALLVAGERPEERYDEASSWLRRAGFASTAEYIARCSEIALECGMFPHTNAGNLTSAELAPLRETNASVGMMLETSSERLGGAGMPHHGAPSKRPAARIRALEDAGRAGIPTTTGILVGIGETPLEAIESLAEIGRISSEYGHIQEIIVQNFQPEDGTAMRANAPAAAAHHAAIAAIARLMMPSMNVQAPPNLTPHTYSQLLSAGINDWGGISPVTPDHVNPAFAWPAIREVERHTLKAGLGFRCRFPAYPERLAQMPSRLRDMARECDDGDGYVREGRWRTGQ